MSLLPGISWADICNYLTNMPSAYAHENLKAYKSLEAFNFFECNDVQDLFHHFVSKESKFCSVKTKVKVKLCDLILKMRQCSVKFQDLEV